MLQPVTAKLDPCSIYPYLPSKCWYISWISSKKVDAFCWGDSVWASLTTGKLSSERPLRTPSSLPGPGRGPMKRERLSPCGSGDLPFTRTTELPFLPLCREDQCLFNGPSIWCHGGRECTRNHWTRTDQNRYPTRKTEWMDAWTIHFALGGMSLRT